MNYALANRIADTIILTSQLVSSVVLVLLLADSYPNLAPKFQPDACHKQAVIGRRPWLTKATHSRWIL